MFYVSYVCSKTKVSSATMEIQLVYRYEYKGCIIDQSNWSGPFNPDFDLRDLCSYPGRGTRPESFCIQVNIYTDFMLCREKGDYGPSLRVKLCLRSQKEFWESYNIP